MLIDTSASMRRGDLWPRAQALAGQVVADCRPADQLAVFAFDATSPAAARLPRIGDARSGAAAGRRQGAARSPGADLGRRPTWARPWSTPSAAIEDVADTSEKAGRMPRRIVLISDLQQGSRLDALGDFEWPSDVELDLKTVADTGSNAGLERLADPVEAEPAEADTRPPRPGRQRPRLQPREVRALLDRSRRSRRSASRSTSTSRPARAASCACPGPPELAAAGRSG